LRSVDDTGHPVERDGSLDIPDPEPTGLHYYALSLAIHQYRSAVEEQHEQLRYPWSAAADSVHLHLKLGSDMQ